MLGIDFIFKILGIILFVWTFVSILSGICNIGTVVALIFSASLTLYGFYFKTINSLLIKTYSNGFGKIVLILAALILSVVIIYTLIITVLMVKSNYNKPQKNTNLIVLGCSVYKDKPSRFLIRRMDTAYDYLIQNPKAVAVLSGGQGPGEDISEARCMFDYLTKKGIPANRLIMEDKSTNTRTNIANSIQKLKEFGIDSNEITITTNSFHTLRATIIAKNNNLIPYATPAISEWPTLPTYYTRELIGIGYQLLFE